MEAILKEITFKNQNLKKYLLAILLLLATCYPTYASIEGRMFLEVIPDPDNKSIVTSSLHKIFQKGIEEKNIRDSKLKLKTENDSILVEDLEFDQEYLLNNEGDFFDIGEILKKSIKEKKSLLNLNISSDFCTQNCKANEYPYIQLLYSFNNPPTITLKEPLDNSFQNSNKVYLQWESQDKDGKFLEHMVEVSKDRFFLETIVFTSDWTKEKALNLNLEAGVYFWRVSVRDNSYLENLVVSETFAFEIGAEEETKEQPPSRPNILAPKNNLITKEKEITLIAQTQAEVTNFVLLNNLPIHSTQESEINLKISLIKEGINVIKVISQKGIQSSEASVTILTNWTPPSSPDFDFKIEDGKVFLKIKNQDYDKAYIHLGDDLVKEIKRSDEWVEVGEGGEDEIKFGIMLEDELGNQTGIEQKTFSPHEEVLGIGGANHGLKTGRIPNPSACRYKYNSTHKRFTERVCSLSRPTISRVVNNTRDNKSYNTNIIGIYNPDFVVIVDEYRCTLKIGCRERFVKRTRINISPYTAIMVYINGSFTRMNEFRKTNKNFFNSYIVSNRNLAGRRANLRYHINGGFRYAGQWTNINLNTPMSETQTIPKATKLPDNKSNRIYRFPFNKNIGVTQWHGYTAYQSPHTGIDFGSYKEPVYAIGNGTIREAKWDNYSGKCLTGGYFVRIEHTNGMNSTYLHLENYKKTNGQNWKPGENIKKGELIGISGNTGYYNCQPLGYHLHFELRKKSSQSTHTNPVPYIDINWNNIPTLQHTKFPGRLTGNNPHPKF